MLGLASPTSTLNPSPNLDTLTLTLILPLTLPLTLPLALTLTLTLTLSLTLTLTLTRCEHARERARTSELPPHYQREMPVFGAPPTRAEPAASAQSDGAGATSAPSQAASQAPAAIPVAGDDFDEPERMDSDSDEDSADG